MPVTLTQREVEIAKIAWRQGYYQGHHHSESGHWAPPEDYDWDVLMDDLKDGGEIFEGISE